MGLTSTRNQMAAARLQNTETKLADFNSKLSQRKDKLEELHLKLKIRKEKLLEREDRLRKFEKVIMEKEAQMGKKEVDLETFSKVLKGKEGLMFDYESSLNHRASKLEEKEKYHSIHINSSGIYEKMEQRPKPILNQDSRKLKKIRNESRGQIQPFRVQEVQVKIQALMTIQFINYQFRNDLSALKIDNYSRLDSD